MTKRVQLAGENAEVEKVLVGLAREVRVDTSNDSLRLHDGVKQGGFEFPNRDQNNALYQKRQLELDGFNFGAQEKGLLVRVGPASYKIRRLTAHAGQFEILHPRGTTADFYFELLETITTNHIWSGEHTFELPINADGGVVGNVTGNLTGNVVGNVTGNLTGNANGNHTGSFTGDVDIRGSTLLTDDGQILEEQIDSAAWIKWGLPYGSIIMWAGDEEDIPESFALCDGTNGTPDLRSRFIIGASAGEPAHTIGGNSTQELEAVTEPNGLHDHDLTITGHQLTIAEMPSHQHGSGVCDDFTDFFNHGSIAAVPVSAGEPDSGQDAGTVEGLTSLVGGGGTHTHAGSTAADNGLHTHDITLDTVDLKPPYYALCFIMKIAA